MDEPSATLQGAPNFRDLGGIRAVGGRVLRHRRLFRSDLLGTATDADLTRIDEFDIRLVVDLRDAKERASERSRWPELRPVRRIVPEGESDVGGVKLTGWTRNFLDPSFDASRARERMIESYRRMPRLFSATLACLFTYLEESEGGAALIHCVAGKDRTGFVCAIVLWALGVSREEIVRDYLLSREGFARSGRLDRVLRQLFPEAIPERAKGVALIVGGVASEYLDSAFQQIRRDFGSIDGYLTQRIGLDSSRRELLQRRLLVEG